MRTLRTRIFAAVAVLALAAPLANCGGGGIPTSASDPRIQQVVQTVQATCSFLPAATSVASIIAAFINGAQPVVDVVSSAANAICGAVQAKALRRGGPQTLSVVVDGKVIPLKGQRL